jgi:hypothetical protein
MRTGVLTHREVARELGKNYVCAWKNIDGEATCGGSFSHAIGDKPGECYPGDGEHNTQIAMFTPEGLLVDIMAGYQTPADLAGELHFAATKLAPIAMNARLPLESRKSAMAREIQDRKKQAQMHNAVTDLNYVEKHALIHWTEFKVDDLVKGRGFGDHFFGRYGKSMPGGGIGNVPEHQQNSIDGQRMTEIRAEAKTLQRQYGLAGERRRAEIKATLAKLEGEYKELEVKSAEATGARKSVKPRPEEPKR